MTVQEVPAADGPADRVARWWAGAVATMERLARDAHAIADHAEHPGSPLNGVVDAEQLREFAGQVTDATPSLLDCAPRVATGLVDPLAGLLPRPAAGEEDDAEHEPTTVEDVVPVAAEADGEPVLSDAEFRSTLAAWWSELFITLDDLGRRVQDTLTDAVLERAGRLGVKSREMAAVAHRLNSLSCDWGTPCFPPAPLVNPFAGIGGAR